MLIVYWLLIGSSTLLATIAHIWLWGTTQFMVPPMIEAVPGVQWHGLAKILFLTSNLLTQWPALLFITPCLILTCGFCFYQKTFKMKIATGLFIFAIIILLITAILSLIGSFDMQEQMTTGMGLST